MIYNTNLNEHISIPFAATNAEDFILQLIAENAQLVANIDRLMAENVQLVTNNDRLMAENVQLVANNDRLMTENARLVAKNVQLAANNNRLMTDNVELNKVIEKDRIVIDRLANSEAFLKETLQCLKNEIADLKGYSQQPKIPVSRLEGAGSKKKWHEIFKKNHSPEIPIAFALFDSLVYRYDSCIIKPRWFHVSKLGNAPYKVQIIANKISRRAKRIIKNTKRKRSKPGQPKGKLRCKKNGQLEIHRYVDIDPEHIPDDAIFKGFKSYLVQDIKFESYNTLYRRSQWLLPNGNYLIGQLPKEVNGHYGPELITYMMYQCHACRVTEPLILSQLQAINIKISSGQISKILTKNLDLFRAEADELLVAGVKADPQLATDDVAGRHKGINHYTTIIGNQYFSIYKTTPTKSRINFLKLLQGGKDHYLINEDTIAYLDRSNVAKYVPGLINLHRGKRFTTQKDWEKFLKDNNVTEENIVRYVTEAALFASLFENGIPRNLALHKDDAGQFDICLFFQTLCWIHEERHYRKLIMTTDQGKADLENVREQIWMIYNNLKTYKLAPTPDMRTTIEQQFDKIFQQKTSSATLNHQLEKTFKKKNELLGVLVRPELQLHNNSSETDARKSKTKSNVSGGTRSDSGRNARDIFLSLQQTSRKNKINFYDFIKDRVQRLYEIPRLAKLIEQRAKKKFEAIVIRCALSALKKANCTGPPSVALSDTPISISLELSSGSVCQRIMKVFTVAVSHGVSSQAA
jgi:hypothetical protein